MTENRTFWRNRSIAGLDGQEVICDVYRPYTTSRYRPALVFLHGGGFVGGDKDQFLGMASWLSMETEALCVTVQYRVAPQGVYPAPIVDCLSVFTWLYENRERLQILPELMFVIGGSPGANMGAVAMMAGSEFLLRHGIPPEQVFQPANGIFLNGIYDLKDFYDRNPKEQKHVKAYLGTERYREELWKEASPISHVRKGTNVLLLHGALDTVVDPKQCTRMKKQLDAAGGRASVKLFAGKSHAWFNQTEELYDVLEEMEIFINEIEREVITHGAESTCRDL